jgi:SAM-dependent methyltransferase
MGSRRVRKALSQFHTSHTEVEADILRAALAPGSRTTRLVAFRDRIDRLVGADIDESGGRANAALDEFVVADLCCTLPFPAGAFDVVYANFVVEHLEQPEHAFAEWHRVLRPGGSVILLTSNLSNPLMAAARIMPQPVRTAVKAARAGRRGAGRLSRRLPSQHAGRAEPAAPPGRVHPRQRRLRGDAAPLCGQTPPGRGSPAQRRTPPADTSPLDDRRLVPAKRRRISGL